MNISVLSAVLKRNLVSYFSSPLGYMFIWLFVFLSALAAFFPNDFFNANLANLDQLNKWFPWIMLFFVPAITMSVWADEVRQGTDELLLTMPATDYDIVLGKYLAVVSIFTVSLLIAMGSNYLVLSSLGSPDVGLYLCTHFGYWLLGLAMLAVGMVASFLTRNLTVAYVLGALFNLPLAFMSQIDIVPGLSRKAADAVRVWSFGGQCGEFGRGILSLSGIVYFLCIAGIMLYLCIILLGRRHWARSDDAGLQAGHFAARVLSLVAITVAAVFMLQNHDLRRDATSERLTSLSPYTYALVDELKDDYKKAQELEQQIAPLEEKQKNELEAAQKAADEKLAKEKADAAKADAAKAATAKSTAAPVAKMADGKPADPKPIAAPAVAQVSRTETKKVEVKPVIPPEESRELNKLKVEYDALKVHGPVRVDAYVCPSPPEDYVQTRLNLLTVLREFKARGGDMVELNINEIESFDPLADVAKSRYGIVPHRVFGMRNGAMHEDKIFMGVAFTCGLEKVVLPFVDKGLSPEYELVRSLCTVTKQKRKRIGVLDTDAHVMGGFTGSGMAPEWSLIKELRKQYEIVPVSPGDLMAPPKLGEEKKYDVLLAVQPSALGPREMDGFIAAVRNGMPTLIFEDPFPFNRGVPGTYQPRRPQQNPMMGFSQENQEKGDIRALWRLLGIDFSDGGDGEEFNPMGSRPQGSGSEKVVWQRYNPYPQFGNTLLPEFVFVDASCGAKVPFDEEDPISSKLQHFVAFGPGFVEDTPAAFRRVVARWNNNQYARKLNKEMSDLLGKIEKAQKEPDEKKFDQKKFDEYVDQFVDAQYEYGIVSAGGEGKKTIQPGALNDDTKLEELIGKIGPAQKHTLADLVNDLRNRCPLPSAEDDADEGRVVLLTQDQVNKLNDDAERLQREAERLEHEASVSKSSSGAAFKEQDRLSRAVELKKVAAKLKRSVARLTVEGVPLEEKQRDLSKRAEDLDANAAKLEGKKEKRAENDAIQKEADDLRAKIAVVNDDIQLLKLRIVWCDQAATLKDQAAELLSKPVQSPGVAEMDEVTAKSKEQLSGFKEMLANMNTVGDVVKYAEKAIALQMRDRKFVPLVQTGPDGGTVPVNALSVPEEAFELRSLFYQPSKGQSYVLAAHIQGKPSERRFGLPVDVVVVTDIDAVGDQVFEWRERGKLLGMDMNFDFDNVPLVLNAIDCLAGDDRFLEIRKRRARHRTLSGFDARTAGARRKRDIATEEQRKEHDDIIRNIVKESEAAKKRVRKDAARQNLDETATDQRAAQEEKRLKRHFEETKSDSDRKYDATIEKVNNQLESEVNAMRATYKLWAVIVPPIPLLVVAAGVFFYRRRKEREGVSSKRLR